MVNRAFIYGDLLFETIKIINGAPALAHAHYRRLMESAAILKFETDLSFEVFVKTITDAVNETKQKEARVRFVLHRNATGFYKPENSATAYFVEVFPLPEPKQSIKIGLYTDNYKPCNELATLKSGNALLYVMAGIWAQENGYDDVLILNEHGCVCESTSSNVFVVKDEKVFTPPISEGCVDGVMRKSVIHQLQEKQYTISERLVTIEEIQSADAVFLTNAISGVVKVSQFENTLYDSSALGVLFM
jgi:branched-chain amino acid aminotransferase